MRRAGMKDYMLGAAIGLVLVVAFYYAFLRGTS